jgi:hypothetical protein
MVVDMMFAVFNLGGLFILGIFAVALIKGIVETIRGSDE